jgi:uncharacterized protein (TIGR04255 family)
VTEDQARQPHTAPEKLAHPPIVEAVVDLDCDMPAGFTVEALESQARAAFRDGYPKGRPVFLHQLSFAKLGTEPPTHSERRTMQALQLMTDDEKQIVQIRTGGFSFNRLSPYSSLDNYLPEIERAWRAFVTLAAPLQVRVARLRYINRILLPTVDGDVDLDDYLANGPRLPDEQALTFTGFLNRHEAVARETGNRVNIILTTQPLDGDRLPVILDIQAFREEEIEPDDWASILSVIQSLRALKNRVFFNSLTKRCVELFHDSGG